MKIKLCILLIIVANQIVRSEIPVLERQVTINTNNVPIVEVLDKISTQAGVTFSYSNSVLEEIRPATINCYKQPVRFVLSSVLGDKVQFKSKGKYIILKKNKNAGQPQKKIVVEGYITGTDNEGSLKDVTVYDKNSLVSVNTDEYGYFKMLVPASDSAAQLIVSKSGYDPSQIKPIVAHNKVVSVPLKKQQEDTNKIVNKINIPAWLLSDKLKTNAANIKDEVFKKVSFSLFPFVGTNKLLAGSVSNDMSFNMTVGYVKEVKVAEFGGVMNIVSGNARFMQCAGVANVVGDSVWGYQAAGVFNVCKYVQGCQTAGALNIVESAKGVQLAGLGNFVSKDAGVQVAGVLNITRGNAPSQIAGVVNVSKDSYSQLSGVINVGKNVYGSQLSGCINIAERTTGSQISGLINVVSKDIQTQVAGLSSHAKQVRGGQVSGFLNTSGEVQGAQVAGFMNISKKNKGVQVAGLINMSDTVEGMQVTSMLNIAGKVDGPQLALINIADTCTGVPIGLFNYVKNGYHKVEVYADELLNVNLAYRTGVKKFFTFFSVGANAFYVSDLVWGYGIGLGTMWQLNEKNDIELNIMEQNIVHKSDVENNAQVFRGYLGFNRKISSNSYLAYGLTYNLMYYNTDDASSSSTFSKIIPYTLSSSNVSTGHKLSSYIGARVGIRF